MVDKDMQLDHARFENIYRKHFDRVAAYLLARADRDLAADALSRTFEVAWRRIADVPRALTLAARRGAQGLGRSAAGPGASGSVATRSVKRKASVSRTAEACYSVTVLGAVETTAQELAPALAAV